MLIAWLTHRWGVGAAMWMIVPTMIGMLLLLTQSGTIRQSGLALKKAATHDQSSKPAANLNMVILLLALIAIHTTVLVGLKTFIPLYFEKFSNLTLDRIALMVTVISLTGALGTLLGGFIAERIGRRAVMIGASLLMTVTTFLFWQTDGWIQLIILGIVGMLISMPWPICVVMVQEAMPNNVGLASGLTLGLAYGAAGLAVAALGRSGDIWGLPTTMNIVVWMPIIGLLISFFVPERARV